MAVDVSRTNSVGRQSMERETVVQLNNLIDELRARALPAVHAVVGTTSDLLISPFCFIDELGTVLCTLETTIAALPTLTVTAASGGFGVMNIVVDSGTGVVTMTTPSTPQVFATRALALAAAAAPAAGTQLVAVVLIEGDGTDWVANTDDLVKGSNLTNFDLLVADDSELPAALGGTGAVLSAVAKITDKTLSYLQ